MGNWNITIRGVGCHHNKALASDANRLAAEFVQKLRDAGHQIVAASFTFGGEDDIADPVQYLDDRDAYDGIEVIDSRRRPRCSEWSPLRSSEGDNGGVTSDRCTRPKGHLGEHRGPPKWAKP